MASSFSTSRNSEVAAQQEDRDKLHLYLFKTIAKNKMLAFTKLQESEFPLRMLSTDQVYSFDADEDDLVHIVTSSS
jgi:hypothetical protein